MTGNTITSSRSTRPAARRAWFIEMLPWERSGTGDSAFRRGTASSDQSGAGADDGRQELFDPHAADMRELDYVDRPVCTPTPVTPGRVHWYTGRPPLLGPIGAPCSSVRKKEWVGICGHPSGESSHSSRRP